MRVGVVVPTLNESGVLASTLAELERQGADDVVVSDGGSSDSTSAIAQHHAVRVVRSPSGRARQLNAGACAVQGDALLFLHADCRLPPRGIAAIRSAFQDAGVVGGGFRKRFDSRHPLLRHDAGRSWLWHRLGYVLGDQGQFVRRSVFERLAGFREDVVAEDMDFAWRLARAGGVVLLADSVVVSPRRLDADGVARTWLEWWRVALAQAARSVREGPRAGDLANVSSVPRGCRGSSGSG